MSTIADVRKLHMEILGKKGITSIEMLPDEEQGMVYHVFDTMAENRGLTSEEADKLPDETELTPEAEEALRMLQKYVDSIPKPE